MHRLVLLRRTTYFSINQGFCANLTPCPEAASLKPIHVPERNSKAARAEARGSRKLGFQTGSLEKQNSRRAAHKTQVEYPASKSARGYGLPDTAKSSPWKLGGLSTGQLSSRTWKAINEDDVFGRAAQIAYYFFFAIFPLAIFLISILGLVVGGSSAQQEVTNALVRGVPPSATQIVRQTVQHSMQASGGGKLSFGIIVALYSASAGMVALIDTLNKVYNIREARGFIKQRAIALGLTIVTGILVLVAIGVFTIGSNVAHHVAGGVLYWVWNVVQYLIAVAILMFSFALIYYFAPNVEHPRWHWVTPGAAGGVFLWILASVGLREYLHYSNSYSSTYGLLGGVMVLLLWFYITGLAILTGGEVNSIIEDAGAASIPKKNNDAGERRRPAA